MAVLTNARALGGRRGDTSPDKPGYLIDLVVADGLYRWVEINPQGVPITDKAADTIARESYSVESVTADDAAALAAVIGPPGGFYFNTGDPRGLIEVLENAIQYRADNAAAALPEFVQIYDKAQDKLYLWDRSVTPPTLEATDRTLWDASIPFTLGALTTGPDGNQYKSIQVDGDGQNLGNLVTDAAWWELYEPGSVLEYATSTEIEAGTVAGKSVNPLGLKTELDRRLSNLGSDFIAKTGNEEPTLGRVGVWADGAVIPVAGLGDATRTKYFGAYVQSGQGVTIAGTDYTNTEAQSQVFWFVWTADSTVEKIGPDPGANLGNSPLTVTGATIRANEWYTMAGGLQLMPSSANQATITRPFLSNNDNKTRNIFYRVSYQNNATSGHNAFRSFVGLLRDNDSETGTGRPTFIDLTASTGYNLPPNYVQHIYAEDMKTGEVWRIKFTVNADDVTASMDYTYWGAGRVIVLTDGSAVATQAALDAETTARVAADVDKADQAALAAEIVARQAGDTAIIGGAPATADTLLKLHDRTVLLETAIAATETATEIQARIAALLDGVAPEGDTLLELYQLAQTNAAAIASITQFSGDYNDLSNRPLPLGGVEWNAGTGTENAVISPLLLANAIATRFNNLIASRDAEIAANKLESVPILLALHGKDIASDFDIEFELGDALTGATIQSARCRFFVGSSQPVSIRLRIEGTVTYDQTLTMAASAGNVFGDFPAFPTTGFSGNETIRISVTNMDGTPPRGGYIQLEASR